MNYSSVINITSFIFDYQPLVNDLFNLRMKYTFSHRCKGSQILTYKIV